MRFRGVISLLILSLSFISFPCALSQELLPAGSAELSSDLSKPEAKIDVRPSAKAGDKVFIDGSASINYYPNSDLTYAWDFGYKNSRSNAKKGQFVYEKPGIYKITLKLSQSVEVFDAEGNPTTVNLESNSEKEIFIYESMAGIIMDKNTDQKHYQNLKEEALNQNFYFSEIISDTHVTGLFGQEKLALSIKEQAHDLQDAELIIIWSDPVAGLNALNHLGQVYKDSLDFTNKTILVVSEGNLATLSRIAESTFLILHPEKILFTPEAAINEILPANGNSENFINILEERGYEYLTLDSDNRAISLWNFFSYAVSQMVSRGVSSQIILYLLMLPVIATIIAFCRQVIGLSTLGVYVPTLMTLVFIFLGLKMGLLVLFTVIVGSLASRYLLKRQRLLYTPKTSLAISIVALFIFALIGLLSITSPAEVVTLAIFPVLVLATLAEKITALESGKSTRDLLLLFGEITLVAIICYLVVGEWKGFQTTMRAYPEIVLLFVIANYFLGRFSGLRLLEYFRFRSLIRELVAREEEE